MHGSCQNRFEKLLRDQGLEKELDFSNSTAYALYAPNGVMKSSLAQTFQDAADDAESVDRIFRDRNTARNITDEQGKEVPPGSILVVLPYNEEFGVTEKTSTLLIDPKMKKEYDNLLRATDDAKQTLTKALRAQSGSKRDFDSEISLAFTRTADEFDNALIRINRELHEQQDAPFADVKYETIFNDKVLAALGAKDLKNAIAEYINRYNELLAASTYFKKGLFDYYNAAQIAKSLADNGFFAANHTVSLKATGADREITSQDDLEQIISQEKEAILTDKALRKRFDEVAKQLQKNAELRNFCAYLQNNEPLLAHLSNPEKLREDVLKSYLKVHEHLYDDWMAKFDAAALRRKEIEEEARDQRTQWESVIAIFNERFFVPFKLEARNRTQVMLGQEAIIDLGFTYIDGADSMEIEKPALLKALSTGERKALYVLNVIFEIETRKKAGVETLVVVDDLADSFDYHNKYAIIQYLKDISEYGLFKLLVMTHNFDFFRTLESRFVSYGNCLMASKNEAGITLVQASGIRNVFANDWKPHFFDDSRKKIASIPFLRNLIEMTTGEADLRYGKLTTMLHWKKDSASVTVADLDAIYNSVCSTSGVSANATTLVSDLIDQEAKGCLAAGVGLNLENKIVLAIAIRVTAERFMVAKINDANFVDAITDNQTQRLIGKFKKLFPSDQSIATLDRVGLMTPENIHINSFMYEPIVDMSDDHLRKLYSDVVAL